MRNSAPHGIRDAGVARELWLINHAYQSGADQELDACCDWLDRNSPVIGGFHLRIDRRPKQPTLKEQALATLEVEPQGDKELIVFDTDQINIIRKALEQLND